MDVKDWVSHDKGNPENAQHQRFFDPKAVSNRSPSGAWSNTPGLGEDGVFRDPWGNPYIISFDMNYDNQTRDAVYRHRSVSQLAGSTTGSGLNGLFQSDKLVPDSYEARTGVMIWSLGPDGAATDSDGNPTTDNANSGVNKDNVTSWGAK